MADLIALAARVEALTGPCRETDCEIAKAIGYCCPNTGQTIAQMQSWSQKSNTIEAIAEWADYPSTIFILPRYTASLDAAMTLVPEGWHLSLCSGPNGAAEQPWWVVLTDHRGSAPEVMPPNTEANAATPALALTAASLRALAEKSA